MKDIPARSYKDNKVCVVVGTRPGIIKMSPIVHQLRRRKVPHYVLHTGQHYSYEMDSQIMKDVDLGEPKYSITRPSNCVSHAEQTAYMLINTEKILLEDRPEVILVCGDANTNLAGALAARKIHVKVGHVEAGLRSFDWRMPEEHNRIIIDHISEYLFAPTSYARKHLVSDGVQGNIFVVGNTIVDATLEHSSRAGNVRAEFVDKLVNGEPFYLLTLHREENVDNEQSLSDIVEGIKQIAFDCKTQILFPVHPRTRKRLKEFKLNEILNGIDNLKMIAPLGYLDFLALLQKASVILTDSGGIQEESCILNIPCLTLRGSTERQETLEIGANTLAGTKKHTILAGFSKMIEKRDKNWKNPYGDGKAAKRIVDTCIHGKPEDEFA